MQQKFDQKKNSTPIHNKNSQQSQNRRKHPQCDRVSEKPTAKIIDDERMLCP